MSDYEKTIQNALRTAFPGCDVHGVISTALVFTQYKIIYETIISFSSYKAIWRVCQDVDLTVAYRRPGVVKRVVKELIALSLLPAEHILSGLQVILDNNVF